MRRRALLVAILVSVMVLSISALSLAEKPKIRLWALRSFVTDANEQLERNAKEWAAKKNVDIETFFFTFADWHTKYVAAIETGDVPDLAEFDPVGPARFYGMGQLLDITDVANEIIKANKGIVETTKLGVFFEGKYYALPHYIMQNVFYVRRDLLNKAGLKPPDTYDELAKAAIKMQQQNPGIYGFGQTWNRSSDGDGSFHAVMWSFGASYSDKEGNYRSIQTPEFKAAVQWGVDLYQKHKVEPPDAMGWTDPSNNEAWLAGKIAMTFNGASIYYKEVVDGHPLELQTLILPLPKGPKERRINSTQMNWGIFAKTKYPELAKDLLRYIMSEEPYRKYILVSVGQTAPAYKKYFHVPYDATTYGGKKPKDALNFKGNYWEQNENFKNIVRAIAYSGLPGYPGQVTPAAAEVQARHTFTDMMGRIIVAGIPMEEAIKEADSRIKKIYETIPKKGK